MSPLKGEVLPPEYFSEKKKNDLNKTPLSIRTLACLRRNIFQRAEEVVRCCWPMLPSVVTGKPSLPSGSLCGSS